MLFRSKPAAKVEEEQPVFRDVPKEAAKEAVEPVVRTKAKAEPAKDLEDVLSAWGDDDE